MKAWWTTEFYLDWQANFSRQHALYRLPLGESLSPADAASIGSIRCCTSNTKTSTDADKTMIEVVGFDNQARLPPFQTRSLSRAHTTSSKTKLILSSDYKGWNISENFITEKNLGHDPWEFGYAVGASRPLRLAATPRPLQFLPREFPGRRGSLRRPGNIVECSRSSGTSHYVAPIVGWQLPSGATLPNFAGLRTQRRQPPFHAALGPFLRNRRLRPQGKESVPMSAVHSRPFYCCWRWRLLSLAPRTSATMPADRRSWRAAGDRAGSAKNALLAQSL